MKISKEGSAAEKGNKPERHRQAGYPGAMIYDTIGWKRNLCLPVFISGGTPDPEHPGGYDMKYSDLSHVWKEIYKAEWESVCRGSKAMAAMITETRTVIPNFAKISERTIEKPEMLPMISLLGMRK